MRLTGPCKLDLLVAAQPLQHTSSPLLKPNYHVWNENPGPRWKEGLVLCIQIACLKSKVTFECVLVTI